MCLYLCLPGAVSNSGTRVFYTPAISRSDLQTYTLVMDVHLTGVDSLLSKLSVMRSIRGLNYDNHVCSLFLYNAVTIVLIQHFFVPAFADPGAVFDHVVYSYTVYETILESKYLFCLTLRL